MLPYLLVSVSVAFLGIISNKRNQRITLAIAFVILAVFSGFRGDFTSDYNNYCRIFDEVNAYDTIFAMWAAPNYTEVGINTAMYLFGRVINSGEWFLCLVSFVTVALFFKEIVRKSPMPWISILIFIGIDLYYDSFNVSRQLLAAALIFSCSRLLTERKFLKYCIAVLLISTIHRTALLMIPMYFLLYIKPTKKNITLLTFVGLAAVSLFPIGLMIVKRIFPMYANYDFGIAGGDWKLLLFPMAVALLCAVFLSHSENQNKFPVASPDRRLQINALIFTIILGFCSMQVYMVMRMIYFFSPYILLLVPNILIQTSGKTRRLLTLIVAVLAIAYPLVVLSGTGYEPYQFIGWDRLAL